MRAARAIGALIVLVLGIGSCASRHSQPLAADDPASRYRVMLPTVEPTVPDQTVFVQLWSVTCSDDRDPAARRLLRGLNAGFGSETLRADDISILLQDLDRRGKLQLLSAPAVAVRAGERADVWLTESHDWPAAQFEVGMKFAVEPRINEDRSISLRFEYSWDVLEGMDDNGHPVLSACRIQKVLRLVSGESAVLGGQRLVSTREDQGEVKTLLVVVNARAIDDESGGVRAEIGRISRADMIGTPWR